MIIFKEGVKKEDILKLSIPTQAMLFYCHKIHRDNGVDMRLTSLISDRANLQNVSLVHSEGRAFDLGIINLNEEIKQKVKEEMLNVFNRVCIGAFPPGTKRPKKTDIGTILVDKTHGNGPHFHFQARPNGFILEEYMDFCKYLLKLHQIEV